MSVDIGPAPNLFRHGFDANFASSMTVLLLSDSLSLSVWLAVLVLVGVMAAGRVQVDEYNLEYLAFSFGRGSVSASIVLLATTLFVGGVSSSSTSFPTATSLVD